MFTIECGPWNMLPLIVILSTSKKKLILELCSRQVAGPKRREHSPRPEWVAECDNICEPHRSCSSISGDFNTYLPPPVTPPNLDSVPLDLYATQIQYAKVRSSIPGNDGSQVQNAKAKDSRRAKKARGCSHEVLRQLRYRGSSSMKEFPHNDSKLAKLVNAPVLRKARWKGRKKERERKFPSEFDFQRQVFEHDVLNLQVRE
jgi:hypothetical protein